MGVFFVGEKSRLNLLRFLRRLSDTGDGNELRRVPTLRILYLGSKLTMCAIRGLPFSDPTPTNSKLFGG